MFIHGATPIDFGANPIQEGYVVARKLQDFRSIEAVEAIAIHIHSPSQFIADGPSQAIFEQTALAPKNDAAEKIDLT